METNSFNNLLESINSVVGPKSETEVDENMSLAPKGKGRKAAQAMYGDKTEETEDMTETYEAIVEAFFTELAENGQLTEDTSDDEIMDIVVEMNLLAHALNEVFESHDISEELKSKKYSKPRGDASY
tara:strand:+ start:5677 stop:6057 length:381 start_codon:yes stop_codon:yes gene_type:complete